MAELESNTISSQAEASSATSVRKKTDAAWNYVSEGISAEGKKLLICLFCNKKNKGGGINRMKQHLAGTIGNTFSCNKVDPEVRLKIKRSLDSNAKKSKEKKGVFDDSSSEGDDIPTQKVPSKGKRKASNEIEAFCQKDLKVTHSSQPSIRACMQNKERWKETDLAIALWFYDACIPFNACNSPYFQGAIDKIANMGLGYKHPSFHALRVNLLSDAKMHVKLIIDSMRKTWEDTGCTIMADGWTDIRQRSLINFLVYCPKGISFVKSVDASDISSTAEELCKLFCEIVEWVGPRNVVHMVTDNGANYKAAGGKLAEKYPFIFWSPCAAHCVNLIFKDVG
ncbi:PREDICTED: uncharacterized protein LOC105976966 [Erythranthe guttata]|uniref:uncharacterized protein LOC105976966 n=1 Tax=Erythranthe guttata TaxID=4155 RepID=UPI00064D930F|nr:PREDICTED: uncharacterized protein LOC105976966 [Erythranthe guttata]|eukprot:XP_012857689.1 PREDICTED: uncharacterized protein LOC105976966 [Erythranthe guttata]